MSERVDLLVRGTVVNVLIGTLEDHAVAIDDGQGVGFGRGGSPSTRLCYGSAIASSTSGGRRSDESPTPRT